MQIRYDDLPTPPGWARDKIGNRLRLNYGKSQAAIKADDGTISIYGTGGLMGYGRQALCDGDSVLIGRKGTLGNPQYFDHPFWPVDTTYYTSDFYGSMKWFYYLIQTVGLSSLNEATGVPSLSRQTFYNLEVLFPPPAEQTAIADILATVDRAIEQTEALIAKQRRIKAGLLHDLLTRGIDEHGHLRDPSTHRFKPSPMGLVPEEWEVVPLGNVGEIGSGVTLGRMVSGANTIELPYLRVANVQDGYIDLSEVKTVRIYRHELARFLLEPGDVLMNEGGDYDKLGRGTVWKGQISPCLHQNHVFRVRVNQATLLPDFLALVSASPYGKRFFVLSSKQSTNLASINSTQLKAFPIPLPPIQEQAVVIDVMNASDSSLETEYAQLSKLQRLKTGLMQDLLSGRVSVAGLADKTSCATEHHHTKEYTV